jgi:hypothetical protein
VNYGFGNGVEENSRRIFNVLPHYLLGCTEESHEKLKLGQPASESRIEPGTFRNNTEEY